MGRIERHNTVWRDVFVKVIDQHMPVDDQQLLVAITATNSAKNSTVRQHGRQAVFGRLPRVPGELLADPSGLVAAANAAPG
eukprot:11194512-Lingulodinium_polyedra.AAC.1